MQTVARDSRWRPLVNCNTIPAVGWKLRIFHTPLLFGAPAPYLPFGISRWS